MSKNTVKVSKDDTIITVINDERSLAPWLDDGYTIMEDTPAPTVAEPSTTDPEDSDDDSVSEEDMRAFIKERTGRSPAKNMSLDTLTEQYDMLQVSAE